MGQARTGNVPPRGGRRALLCWRHDGRRERLTGERDVTMEERIVSSFDGGGSSRSPRHRRRIRPACRPCRRARGRRHALQGQDRVAAIRGAAAGSGGIGLSMRPPAGGVRRWVACARPRRQGPGRMMTVGRRSIRSARTRSLLSPAEAEAAAARAGLRVALRGGLSPGHLAPLAAFALIVAFASVLALTGLISRRAGEATIILAAAAFMIQRAGRRTGASGSARRDGLAAMARMQTAGAVTATFDERAVYAQGRPAHRSALFRRL